MSLKDNDLQSLNGSWYNSISRLIAIFNQSRSFVNDLQNVYRKSWKESMQSCTGKLRTYSKFKTDFTQENYLIQFPMHVRRNFTKLRISAHNLAIETGRYTNAKSIKSSEIDKRLCFHCKKNVESEHHLIFECNLYIDARELFSKCLGNFTCIPFDGTDDSFLKLMSYLNGDLEVGLLLCNYVNTCFDIRRDCINSVKENFILCRPETTTTRVGRISKRPNRIDL